MAALAPPSAGVPPDLAEAARTATGPASPPTRYLVLGFDDGAVLVDLDGRPFGLVDPMPAPEHPVERLRALTDEASEPIPDGCMLEERLGQGQLRLVCTDRGEQPDANPTVEVLLPDGERVVVGALPPPPEDLAGAFRIGRFLRVFPAPGRRNLALAQFSAECEVRVAVIVEDGVARHVTGAGWWDEAWPAGESIALGWDGERGEALVWWFGGPCTDQPDVPGVYAFGPSGESRLVFATPPETQWVELIGSGQPFTTAGLYPPLGRSDIEALAAGNEALPLDVDVVRSFAADVLGLADVQATNVAEGTDVAEWVVEGGSLSVSVRTEILAWQADGDAIVAVTHADSTGGLPLVAEVFTDDGDWQAHLSFPMTGEAAAVELASGDWAAATEATTGDVTLELPAEPVEAQRVTIAFTAGGALVGFYGTILPPGAHGPGR